MFKDPMSWGSCQYTGAKKAFDVVMEVPKENRIAELNKAGLTVDYREVPVKQALATIIGELQDEGYFGPFEHGSDELKASLKAYRDEDHKNLSAAENADEMFAALRKASWDLWGAAPYVAWAFGLTIDGEIQTENVAGPIFNQMAQSDNAMTGIHCALLMHYGIVKEEDSFNGFDT